MYVSRLVLTLAGHARALEFTFLKYSRVASLASLVKDRFHYVSCFTAAVALCFHISLLPSLYLEQSPLGLQMCTIAASYAQTNGKSEVTNTR